MLRRISIVTGLTVFFVVALFALASCGADAVVSNTDLQNAAGSGNGPGSGKWQPPKPTNQRQARQLYLTIETLVENTNKTSAKYDQQYPLCLNEEGKLLASQEDDTCVHELRDFWVELHRMFTDYRAGTTAYDLFAQEADDGEETPPAPDPPKVPKEDPPDKDDEEEEDWSWRCLTCIHTIDNPEFAFIDMDVVLNN